MESQTNSNMIEATDALEAVEACRGMKNFLFLLILLAMLICQLVFWMNRYGLVDNSRCSGCAPAGACPAESDVPGKPQASAADMVGFPLYLTAMVETENESQDLIDQKSTEIESLEQSVQAMIESKQTPPQEGGIPPEKESDVIRLKPADRPAEQTGPEASNPQISVEKQADGDADKDELSLLRISCRFASVAVSICNFVIVAGSILYCLTLLMCVKISLAGRLGGLNHICRAFFVSLFLLVVVIPWQQILPGVLVGSVWRPGELLCGGWAKVDGSVLCKILYYLRFCGLWIVGLWLLWWAQGRSKKWARATLRRLGVVR